LELKNTQLMALFAELDPDPVLRTNKSGEIIYINNAIEQLNIKNVIGEKVTSIIPSINLSFEELIINNKSVSFSLKLDKKYYSILIRGNSFLEIAQLYFTDITSLKKLEYRIRRSRKRLKQLSAHLIEKLEEEKYRLARELHDGIGQNLLFLKLKIQKLEDKLKLIKYKDPEIKNINILLGSTIQDLKNILYELKPRVLEEAGLKSALSLLCNKLIYEGDLKGNIDIVGLEDRLDSKLEVAVYRIVQEALNNIVKHSKAQSFNVQLLEIDNTIRLIISDDGIGFNVETALYGKSEVNSFGLFNMKERTENYKGRFKIESTEGAGTVIVVEIPLIKEMEYAQ